MQELRFSEFCANCRKSLAELERILFVEKEIGRCFCAERCIEEYFQPIVESMAHELSHLRSEDDFTAPEFQRFEQYRNHTLQDPDEVWLEESESGERYYTFISRFHEAEENFNYVVVCLTLDGTPSFVFLSFPTRDEDLLEQYRRGIDLRVFQEDEPLPEDLGEASPPPHELERIYSELRHPDDIPKEQFQKFDPYIEVVLDDPEEIWTFNDGQGHEWYTFIGSYMTDPDRESLGVDEFTMVVVCSRKKSQSQNDDTALSNRLEVIFAFPTIDPGFVQQFRRGINSLNKAFGIGGARRYAA